MSVCYQHVTFEMKVIISLYFLHILELLFELKSSLKVSHVLYIITHCLLTSRVVYNSNKRLHQQAFHRRHGKNDNEIIKEDFCRT